MIRQAIVVATAYFQGLFKRQRVNQFLNAWWIDMFRGQLSEIPKVKRQEPDNDEEDSDEEKNGGNCPVVCSIDNVVHNTQ